MARVISLDNAYKFTDPRLQLIQQLLTKPTNQLIKLTPRCSLMSSASRYIRDSHRPTLQPSDCDQNRSVRSISTNNSKIRTKRNRKKQHDVSEVVSENVEVVLGVNYHEQPDVVLRYLMSKDANSGHRSEQQKEILNGWVMCLDREDRMEVERERTWFPNPRTIELRKIDAGLNEIYGVGPKRRLRPGQQASIIQSIQKFLNQCSHNPHQIALRQSLITETLLSWAELQDLTKYPFCMKQVWCHFRIMATRWRYSGKLDLTNKNVEKAVGMAQGRKYFIDLARTEHPLVKYLMKYPREVAEGSDGAVGRRRRNTLSGRSGGRQLTTEVNFSQL